MPKAVGEFEITSMSEEPYHESPEGVKLTRARGTQRFSGDLEGEGSVEWLMCYLPDGSATFSGLQRIEGTLAGRSGTFVMTAAGTHDGERSKADWIVIHDSGAAQLAGISGDGSFLAPSGPTANYELDYEVPG
jgi:Protein of unknown function (DUF3224)